MNFKPTVLTNKKASTPLLNGKRRLALNLHLSPPRNDFCPSVRPHIALEILSMIEETLSYWLLPKRYYIAWETVVKETLFHARTHL